MVDMEGTQAPDIWILYNLCKLDHILILNFGSVAGNGWKM